MKTFLYLHAGDLALARHFYTDLVGLEEVFFSGAAASDDDATVGYRLGTLQLTITAHGGTDPHPAAWAAQLGWDGGSGTSPSWGIEFDGDRFRVAVAALRKAGVPGWSAEPQWVGYWSYPVQDPMGNTVEISTPDRDSWTPG